VLEFEIPIKICLTLQSPVTRITQTGVIQQTLNSGISGSVRMCNFYWRFWN